MFHMVGYYGNIQQGAPLAFANLTPIADPTVTIDGNLLYVPSKYSKVMYVIPSFDFAAVGGPTQIQAPSLRQSIFPSLTPVWSTGGSSSVHPPDYRNAPLDLVTNEGLEFKTQAGGNGVQKPLYGFVFLTDAAAQPTKGKVLTLRSNAITTVASTAWVNFPMTFNQTLPVGSYDVVGMRVEANGGIAARLVFIGASAVVRPGTLSTNGDDTPEPPGFRMGELGVWGTFDSVTPPSVDIIAGTATSFTVFLDLIAH